jgi:hypothetical protein
MVAATDARANALVTKPSEQGDLQRRRRRACYSARMVCARSLLALAWLVVGCSADPQPRSDAAPPAADAPLPADAAMDRDPLDVAPQDGPTPDGPPADGPVTVDPVVYGAYGAVGNTVCSQVHPPATVPCQVHSLAWLKDIYGVAFTQVTAAELAQAGAAYRLVEVAEDEGPVAIAVWVVDAQGAKLSGANVTFCYPVATDAAGQLSCSANTVPVVVKPEGHADFTMTADGYIGCGQPGPYAAWVSEPSIPSDRVYGLGMLAGTNHRHVNLLFQRVTAGQAPADATRCPLAE